MISNDYYLEKNYDVISYNYRKNEDFCYKYDKLTYCSTAHFKLTDKGLKMEGIYVSEDDFPIVIRNYKSDDKVKLKEGTKNETACILDVGFTAGAYANLHPCRLRRGELLPAP